MHQEGFGGPQSNAEPKAFAFDGWSMVPIVPEQAVSSILDATPVQAMPEPDPATPQG